MIRPIPIISRSTVTNIKDMAACLPFMGLSFLGSLRIGGLPLGGPFSECPIFAWRNFSRSFWHKSRLSFGQSKGVSVPVRASRSFGERVIKFIKMLAVSNFDRHFARQTH